MVRSRKYDVAVNKETPVMLSDWVDTVWERGKLDNIHATDPQFARFVVLPNHCHQLTLIKSDLPISDRTISLLIKNHTHLLYRYKCPALFGLNITVSQMNRKDREVLKRSIESHGGIYSGSLDMNTTV